MNSSPGNRISVREVLYEYGRGQKEFFDRCDREYETVIDHIAETICGGSHSTRLLMLSGPSSSGKTTSSLKIQHRLGEMGVHAVTISMDDFFRPREEVPLQPDGSRNFEALEALDLPRLRRCLRELIDQGSSALPVFDFKAGQPAPGKRIVLLPENSVAIVEGLHALDSRVTEELPGSNVLKLYISVGSDFVDENGGMLLSRQDVRLIRRTIRDNKYRNSRPENTLDMWDAVCRGEDLYVRPFKRQANIIINSVFPCEPCLFRSFAGKLFSGVPKESRHFDTAARLIRGLARFPEMPMSLVPETCVLREFTGGSLYYRKNK